MSARFAADFQLFLLFTLRLCTFIRYIIITMGEVLTSPTGNEFA